MIGPVALVVSCLTEGLLLVDGGCVEHVDHVPTAGLAVGLLGAARALHEPSETALAGDLILEGGRRLRIPGLVDVHELTWDGELLACVSTLTNEVLWADRSGRVVRRWGAPGQGDCWHLSGLVAHRGHLLVTAFGRFARHRDWAEADRDREGLVVEANSGRVVRRRLSSPHSPRVVGGRLAFCDSGRGDLVVGDRRVHLGGWTRGLTIVDDDLVVGVSAPRGTEGLARLVRVRASDLAPVGRVDLPVREVFDIATLSRERARALALPASEAMTMPALRPTDLRAALEVPRALTLAPGALADVDCTVTNLACAPLATARPFPIHVVSRWTPSSRALWSSLPGVLEPGRSTVLQTRVLAPAGPGRYTLEIGLVQEGVAWLDGAARAEVCVA
jgi:hypothetical protein